MAAPLSGFTFSGAWESPDNGTLYQESKKLDDFENTRLVTEDEDYIANDEAYNFDVLSNRNDLINLRWHAEFRAAHDLYEYNLETLRGFVADPNHEVRSARDLLRYYEEMRIRGALNNITADIVLLWQVAMGIGENYDDGERDTRDPEDELFFFTLEKRRFSMLKFQHNILDILAGRQSYYNLDISVAPPENVYDETFEDSW